MRQNPSPYQLGGGSLNLSSRYSRRDFIHTLTMALMAAGITGCGSDDTSGNTGFGGFQGTTDTQASGLQGRVQVQAFGGGTLTVQTIQSPSASVGNDGTFSTTVTSNKVPQLIFLTGQAPTPRQLNEANLSNFFPGPLKGLGLYLPDASEAFELSLNSTAVALVFLTFGILTTDLSEAGLRIRRIVGLSSFAGLIAGLGRFLVTGSLSDAGNDDGFLALKQACVDEYFASSSQNKLSQEEYLQLRPQGLLKVQKGEVDSQNRQTISFENHGFRFVSVIRQELDGSGTESTTHLRPRLIGANTGGATTIADNVNGLLGGGNTQGWGNIFTGQTEDPGLGADIFTPFPSTTRVRYWILGPGRGDAATELPAGIQEAQFGRLSLILTGIYYFILPLFDLISGGLAGLLIHRLGPRWLTHDSVENLEALADYCLGSTAVATASDGLYASYKTGNQGNINSGWIDLLAAIVGVLSSVALTAVETLIAEAVGAAGTLSALEIAAFALLGELSLGLAVVGLSLLALSAVFAVNGLRFCLFNMTRAIKDHQALPALATFTVVLRTTPYDIIPHPWPHLSNDFASGIGFNDSSDVLVALYDSTVGINDFIWRPLLGGVLDPDRPQVGPLTNSGINNPQDYGYVNNQETILYLAYHEHSNRYLTMVQKGVTSIAEELTDPAFGPLSLPVPWGLNELNQVAGTLVNRFGPTYRGIPFIYNLDHQSLLLIDIAAELQIPGAVAALLDINDAGYMVGAVYAGVDPSTELLGIFVYFPDGHVHLLPNTPGSLSSPAVHINNQLHVFYAANGVGQIVDVNGNLVRQLQVPQGGFAVFERGCFNDLDQVVGQINFPEAFVFGRSYLWESDGTPTDLTDFWPTQSREGQTIPLFFVRQINNAGVILGSYNGVGFGLGLARPRS